MLSVIYSNDVCLPADGYITAGPTAKQIKVSTYGRDNIVFDLTEGSDNIPVTVTGVRGGYRGQSQTTLTELKQLVDIIERALDASAP